MLDEPAGVFVAFSGDGDDAVNAGGDPLDAGGRLSRPGPEPYRPPPRGKVQFHENEIRGSPDALH